MTCQNLVSLNTIAGVQAYTPPTGTSATASQLAFLPPVLLLHTVIHSSRTRHLVQ